MGFYDTYAYSIFCIYKQRYKTFNLKKAIECDDRVELGTVQKKEKKASCQKFVVSSSINKNLAPKSVFWKFWKIPLLLIQAVNSSFPSAKHFKC